MIIERYDLILDQSECAYLYTVYNHDDEICKEVSRGRDGAVVRALASHRCGPGWISRHGVTCGLRTFVVGSRPCSKGFFFFFFFLGGGSLVFLPPQKPTLQN